jgi:hypothetical protein
MQYEWERFWMPAGGKLSLGMGGYMLDPRTTHGRALNAGFQGLSEHAAPCLVLLGEAGMGKSAVIEQECERLAKHP